MRKIGYIRVSSTSQNPSRQFQQLNEIGMDMIFEEKVSGATKDREQLQKMLEDLREGDIVYVTDLTRITRSTQDLFELIDIIRRAILWRKQMGVASGKWGFTKLSIFNYKRPEFSSITKKIRLYYRSTLDERQLLLNLREPP